MRILAFDQYTVEHAAHVLRKCSVGSGIHYPSLFCSICQVTWSLYWLKASRTLHVHSLTELSGCVQ